jgi:hypothetical protein
MADQGDIYELEQLAIQPGTYFNPQTEVIVIVDDSTSVDQDVFNMEEFEGAEWVRISDEVPVDEAVLEEAMESFQSTYHPTGGTVTAAALDPDEPEPDNATLEPDLDLDLEDDDED